MRFSHIEKLFTVNIKAYHYVRPQPALTQPAVIWWIHAIGYNFPYIANQSVASTFG